MVNDPQVPIKLIINKATAPLYLTQESSED
jgi:hypothetical protein